MQTIIGIAAASGGWRAVYGGEHDHEITERPVAAWALIRNEGMLRVVGVGPWQGPMDLLEDWDFTTYASPGQSAEAAVLRAVAQGLHLG